MAKRRRLHVCNFSTAAVAALIERIGEERFVSLRVAHHASPCEETAWIATVAARGKQYETSPAPSAVAALQDAVKFLDARPRGGKRGGAA